MLPIRLTNRIKKLTVNALPARRKRNKKYPTEAPTNGLSEKQKTINTATNFYLRYTYQCLYKKLSKHLQTIQQEMLPKPTEMQRSKQKPSVADSDKNCSKPSGELHQLLIPLGEEPKEMLPLSVVMGKKTLRKKKLKRQMEERQVHDKSYKIQHNEENYTYRPRLDDNY
jgi:hypothetical protein